MDKIIAILSGKFPELTESDVLLSVEIIVNAMSSQLIRGGRIELRGFGTFRLNEQMTGVSANTLQETNGLEQEAPVVIFKPGLIIRERINNMSHHDSSSEQVGYLT